MSHPGPLRPATLNMLRRLSSVVFPWGLLALVVGVFYGKAVFCGHLFMTNDIAGSDMMMQSFPARVEAAAAFSEGRLPLWTDDLFLGFPVAAEGQAGTFYPPNILAFLLLDEARAYTGLMVLHVILAGLFTMLYARTLGRSRAAALLAGLVVCLSAFWVTHLKHVNLIASAAWIPLGFWLVERWSRNRVGWRTGVWLGVLVALEILAGHVPTAYNALLMTGLYLLVVAVDRSLRERSSNPLRRGLIVAALMLAVGAGLSAIQTTLSYEYTQLGTRSGGLTYEEATVFDYRLRDLVMFVDPYRYGDPGLATYTADGEVESLFWENCGYLGILPLALALLGGVFAWRERRVKFLVGLTGLSMLLVPGSGSPVHALFFHLVPGFDRFRCSSRFLLFVTLSVAVLAAFGLDWLSGRVGRRQWRAAINGVLIAGAVANLFAFGYTHNPTLPADLWLSEPESARFLKQDPSRFRIWSPRAELLHLEAYRRAKGWKWDLTPYLDQRNALQPNLNGLYGVPSIGFYFPIVPTRFLDEMTGLALTPPRLLRILSLYNVKYILAGEDIRDPHLALRARVRGGIRIYESLGVLPRARIVPVGVPVTDPRHALGVIVDERFDPERMVALEGWRGDVKDASTEGSTVREVSRRAGRVELEASMTGWGFLVLADAHYPGWEVWVDGRRGEILQANVVCRAVALPPGEHSVVFHYRPVSFLWGAVVSAAALAVLGAIFGWDLGRGRDRSDRSRHSRFMLPGRRQVALKVVEGNGRKTERD